MFLTETELNAILDNTFFSQPYTIREVHYELYRGHINTVVHTLRFNIIPQFNEGFIVEILVPYLLSKFAENSRLIASIGYDLILVDPTATPVSYYIWRANSNAVHFNADHETSFVVNHNNIAHFVHQSFPVDVSSLDLYFRTSNVQIDRVIAVVFSFYKI